MENKLKNGFTLVELLIAMVVGLVIMAAIYAMMNLSQGSSSGVSSKVMTQQDTRAVLDLMAMEIRMASYNPSMSPSVWGTDPMTSSGKCATLATFVSARKGIQSATANSILVAMDLNGDAVVGYPNVNEYLSYAYNSGNGSISRSVTCGSAEDLLGGTGSSTLVRNNLTAPATPVFQYFDANGTEITAASIAATPDASIPLIRRIRINLVVDVATQGGKFKITRKTYSTDVLVRNHALSR